MTITRGYIVNCESMKTKIYRADPEFKDFMYSLRNWNYISKLAQDWEPGQTQTIWPLKYDCPWEPSSAAFLHMPLSSQVVFIALCSFGQISGHRGAFPGGSGVKNLPANAGDM